MYHRSLSSGLKIGPGGSASVSIDGMKYECICTSGIDISAPFSSSSSPTSSSGILDRLTDSTVQCSLLSSSLRPECRRFFRKASTIATIQLSGWRMRVTVSLRNGGGTVGR